MHAFLQSTSEFLQQTNLTAFLLDAGLKSFVILAVAGGLYCFCGRASASARHLIWFLAIISLLVLPVLSSLLPSWKEPLWSLSTGVSPGNQFSVALELTPATEPIMIDTRRRPERPERTLSRSHNVSVGFDAGWLSLTFVAWLTGVALTLLSIAFSYWRVAGLCRQAKPLEHEDWSMLLRQSSSHLGLRRRMTLLRTTRDIVPMTCGWWRPIVLLPAEADEWPAERRGIVLLHELAHVRRWDCLSHFATRIVCALYWFNPLAWIAARAMCAERERACDDLVLNAGCKASDYAAELVEIARSFSRPSQVAAITMARCSKLQDRVAAILDASRARRLRPITILALSVAAGALTVCQGGCKTHSLTTKESESLRQKQIARLREFSAAKEKHSRALAVQDGDPFFPDFATFFDAAVRGDGQTVTNMYDNFKRRHGQYENTTDDLPHKSYWSPVLEVGLAYYEIMAGEPKYEQLAIDGVINSIPPGSIFFGGTDPGRGLPTAFSKSHVDADPFFTITQNALADGTYLTYLRRTYGDRIYTPTEQDSANAFQEYVKDAERRLDERKLKPGENVKRVDGRVQVGGQVSVMAINALLAKVIFDKNPKHEFYIEESFPLEWMYPHLSPNGSIMKINRQPLATLSDDVLRRDREHWQHLVSEMIGDWLNEETSVRTVTAFAEKVWVRRNLQGFSGDPRFVRSQHAQKLFSKLRSSIGGVYAWRVTNETKNPTQRERMRKEADLAFRQAFAMCPHSPEAVFRYINLLLYGARVDEAILVANVAAKLEPTNKSFQDLVKQLSSMTPSKKS